MAYREAKLADLTCFISRGITPSYTESDGVCVVNQKCIRNEELSLKEARLHDEKKRKVPAEKMLRPMDILVNSTGTGTLGRVAQVHGNITGTTVDSHVTIVRPSGEVDPLFLGYAVKWRKPYIEALAEGSTGQTELSRIRLGDEVTIPVPSFAKQKQIGDLLYTLDCKIKINSQINDNLQQQAAMIFREWFITNPETEMWPLVTLDSLTSLISRGITPKYNDDSTQVVLNQKCIRDHFIDTALARKHSPKAINEKWLKYGDLLINSTGEGTLGRTAQVWFVPDNMTVDSHVTIVRPKNQQLIFYIGLWGLSHEREIESLHTGSTGQTELPRDRVKALELRMPDSDILTRFNSVIEPMVSSIIVNQQENSRLANIRDALLPRLMSGELDISDIQL